MNKNVPVYFLILAAIFAFGLGLVLSPFMGSGSNPPSVIPSPDDTISIAPPPGGNSLQCNWCGGECVELGSRTQCTDNPVDPNLWCGPQEIDGQQVCQATTKADVTACDANNSCDPDESCYAYPDLGAGKCVGSDEDPCQFCSSGKCSISPATIYPPQVICE